MVGMTTLRERETQSATHKRDGEPVGQFEVRFTDPKAFVQDLKADHQLDAIEDNVVRIAIVNGPANDGQVDVAFGMPLPAPRVADRHNPYFRSKYVESAYQSRGQLVKLSSYCGIAPLDDAPEQTKSNSVRITDATAKAIQSVTRTVQAALHQAGIEPRGGGFYVQDGPWTAWPDSLIDATPALTCAVCGIEVYWANGHWRGPDRMYEVWLDAGMDGRRPKKTLDHEHSPEVPE